MKKKQKNSIKKSFFEFSEMQKTSLLLCLILIVTFFIFFQTHSFEFLTWDDDKQVTENQYIKKFDSETFKNLYEFDKHTSVSLLTFAVEYQFWGLSSKHMHLNNVLLHLLNIFLIFIFLKLLFGNNFIALFAALLFALHPSRVESVAWISERKDLFYTFWSLLSLIFYTHFLQGKNKHWIVFIVITFASLSGLSKIQGVALIPILFLLDFYYKRKFSLTSVFEKFIIFYILFILTVPDIFLPGVAKQIISLMLMLGLLYFIKDKKISLSWNIAAIGLFALFTVASGKIILLSGFLVWFAMERFSFQNIFSSFAGKQLQHKTLLFVLLSALFIIAGSLVFLFTDFAFWSPETDPTTKFYAYERIFLAAASFLFYLGLFLFPFNLNAIHPYPFKHDGYLPSEYYFAPFIAALVIGLGIWILLRKNIPYKRELIFCLLFFIISISLVLHIIPIQGRLVFADRYSYFGFIGLFAATGFIIEARKQWFQKQKWLLSILILYLFSMTVYGYIRTSAWKDSITLFTDVLSKNPDVSVAHNNLGAAMLKSGSKEKTLFHLNRAIKLDSCFDLAYYNRAMAFYQFNKLDEAEKDLLHLISKQKDSLELSVSYNDLGMVYLQKNNLEEAKKLIHKALVLNQKLAKAYNNSGWIKYLQQDYDGAINEFNKALKYNPELDEALTNRGWCKLLKGNKQAALEDFNKAVEINPRNAKALSNRGTLRSNQGDINGAIEDLTSAIEADPEFEVAYANRGFAYFNKGDLQHTIKDYSAAIKLNPEKADHYLNRGWAFYLTSKYNDAENDYQKAISLGSEEESVLINMGIILHKNGKSDSGKKYLNKVIAVNNKNEKAFFFKGIIATDEKQYSEAIKHLNASISLNNKNSDAFLYRGKCYLETGNKIKACEDFKTSASLGNKTANKFMISECK